MLVINAGSSSIRYAVFDDQRAVLAGRFDVGPAGHGAALAQVFAAMEGAGVPVGRLDAAAHRVVHGGAGLLRTCRIDGAVEAAIAACVPLAPLHNPANLAAIRALAAMVPGLAQYACFDTAFHATNPEVAVRYALPEAERARGIRRYGFHGLSYASLVARLPGMIGGALPKRLLALHLGNGASLCAILEGRSVATTMGYSPLDGLTMGTRAGGIDGNAVLRLAEVHGVAGAAQILNQQSGLLGLGGSNDMRELRATEAGRFARAHFAYWVQRHAGSMMAAMGGVDALAFTGGIGENDAEMRAAVIEGLSWCGVALDSVANAAGALRIDGGEAVSAWIVAAEEERWIAREALAVRATEGLA